MISGNILITGGTGSLGTAILDKAFSENWPAAFTVLARNETKMAQLKAKHPNVRCEIGDVRDLAWLNTIVPGHDVCIHAAAIKQVPTAESNVREAILTNVFGSQNVAMACVEAHVGKVIGISTDKACAPTTVYGATKYLMEGLFREADQWSKSTRFITVRYGNVLRSNASVLPLFERQIAEDKPFTVTVKEMTRFWLTMPQAIHIVETACDWDTSGVVLVPRPPAMHMYDLAHALDPDREIIEIGIRPGEKINEQLINESESLHVSVYDGYKGHWFVIYPPTFKTDNKPFTYDSNDPDHWMTYEELYAMLDEYNPYGGRKWAS